MRAVRYLEIPAQEAFCDVDYQTEKTETGTEQSRDCVYRRFDFSIQDEYLSLSLCVRILSLFGLRNQYFTGYCKVDK